MKEVDSVRKSTLAQSEMIHGDLGGHCNEWVTTHTQKNTEGAVVPDKRYPYI
jgi:hypothetical protein